jgi:hypothetical protein
MFAKWNSWATNLKHTEIGLWLEGLLLDTWVDWWPGLADHVLGGGHRATSGDVGWASGGGRWTEGPVEIYHLGSRIGAEKVWWNIFPSDVAILGCGSGQGSCRYHGCQRGQLRGSVRAGCHLIALPWVGARARATWVWAQCGPDRGSAGCPLGPDPSGLGVIGFEYYSVGCSWLSWWHRGRVVVALA